MNGTKHVCPICGKEPKRPKSIYCSPQCWGASRRGQTMPRHRAATFKTCPVCGKQFQVGRPTGKPREAIYCSRPCAGEAQRKYYTCKQCGQQFRSSRRVANQQYCSRVCYGESRIGMGAVDLVCVGCGTPFRAALKKKARQYCTIDCRRKHSGGYVRGPDHPNWKGGTFIAHGYVYEQDTARPPRKSGKPHYRRQHVRVMEEMVGRPLERGEHVHHVSGDTTDNRPVNLMLLKAGAHSALHHHFAQEYMRIHREAGDLESLTLAFIATHAAG